MYNSLSTNFQGIYMCPRVACQPLLLWQGQQFTGYEASFEITVLPRWQHHILQSRGGKLMRLVLCFIY